MIVISKPWLALALALVCIVGTIFIDLGSLAFDDCIYSENWKKLSRKKCFTRKFKKKEKKK